MPMRLAKAAMKEAPSPTLGQISSCVRTEGEDADHDRDQAHRLAEDRPGRLGAAQAAEGGRTHDCAAHLVHLTLLSR